MALYISISDSEGTDMPDIVWHVGKKTEKLIQLASQVTEIQADGDELEFIRRNFDGLPMAKQRVVSWYGDMAKFIIGNLRYYGGKSEGTEKP